MGIQFFVFLKTDSRAARQAIKNTLWYFIDVTPRPKSHAWMRNETSGNRTCSLFYGQSIWWIIFNNDSFLVQINFTVRSLITPTKIFLRARPIIKFVCELARCESICKILAINNCIFFCNFIFCQTIVLHGTWLNTSSLIFSEIFFHAKC